MHPHAVLHIALIVSLSVALAVSAPALLLGVRRGDGAVVRRSGPQFVGLALVLAGQVLRDGPHGTAGDLLFIAGGIVVLVGAVRFSQWQRRNRRAA